MKYVTDRARRNICSSIILLFNFREDFEVNKNIWDYRPHYSYDLYSHATKDYFSANEYSTLIKIADKYLSKLENKDDELLRLYFGIDDGKLMQRKDLALFLDISYATLEKRVKLAYAKFTEIFDEITQEDKNYLKEIGE